MDEEKIQKPDADLREGSPAGAPSDQKAPVQPDGTPEQHQKRRQRSVFQYIAILFAAAFVLLLLTYVMDRRQYELIQDQNQAQINDLLQSATAVQSLQNLNDENAALKDRVEDLQERLDQAEQRLEDLTGQVSELEESLSKTSQAMDWFWQINEAYVRGRYSLCRELIQAMEAGENGQTPLKEYLPKESTTDNGRFSPYDRYQEIYEALY